MSNTEITLGKRVRQLGCLKPPTGFVSSIPVFKDHVEPLDKAWLERMAKDPVSVGRTIFGTDYIKSQVGNSCNGVAGAMALTRSRVRRGLKRVDLSGGYLYSLINGNRDNGSMLDAGMKVIQDKGIAPVDLVPLDRLFRKQYDTSAADRAAKKYMAYECYRCEEIEDLWTALALGWDCVVVVHVGNGFERFDSNGLAGYSRGQGNHAVGAQGILWAGGEIVADAYNSWGKAWGNRGHMLLSKRHFEQTIGVHSFYAIRSASDGDDSPPKPIR